MNSSMKATGRFALVLGVLICAFCLLLLLAPPAAAQHTGTGMMLPGGSGGMTTAAADARYLKLDATNDPLTGALTLPQSTAAAPSLNFAGATTTGVYQTGTGIGFTRGGNALFDVGSSISYAQLYTSYFLLNSGTLELDVFSGLFFFSGATAPAIGSAHTVNTASTYRANGGLSIYSAVSSGGGYAVAIGSSSDMASGGILLSVADLITSAGTPSRKFNFYEDGYMQAGAGAAGTPTYSFILDPNTGIYNSAADTIDFAAGGVAGARVTAAGILPGADNARDLGSAALTWATTYTKVIADQAGTARIQLDEAGSTTFTATAPATAGADVGFIMDSTGNFTTNTDTIWELRENGSPQWTLQGDGSMIVSNSPTAVHLGNGSTTGIGFFGSGASAYIKFSTVTEDGRFDQTGLTLQTGRGIAFNGLAAAGNQIKANQTNAEFTIYNGVMTGGVPAVGIGSSNNTATGINLMSVCYNCDSSPVDVAVFSDAGSLQLDGDLTVDGGDITVSTVASITNVGDAQFDGTLQVDTGLKIGTAGTTITESNSVSTGSVDFASISADTCGEKTLTVTGADVNTPVACSFPAALEANLIGMCFVSAADTVTIRLCNMTAVAIDPAAATFGARTLK